MMTSNLDSDSLESTDTNASAFFAPSCAACTRQKKSVAYCVTCKDYLCGYCDFTHKITICFDNHRVISLEKVENVGQLEKLLNPESEPFETKDAKIQKLLQQLENYMEFLGRQRFQAIGYVNEIHEQYQRTLKQHREKVVQKVNDHFNQLYKSIMVKQEEINASLTRLKPPENANTYDWSKILTCNISSTTSPFSTSEVWSMDSTSDNNLLDEAAGFSTKKNVSSYVSSLDIPIDTTYKCHVNPDLSLITTDPGSPPNTNFVNSMQIAKTFGQKGNGCGQFNSPHGFCLGPNEDVVVADTGNHRIQVFDKNCDLTFQFGVPGRHDGYLWHPRKIAWLPRQRRYVICDRGYERSRMQIFSENGKFVKKIYIQYIDIVAGVAVTPKENIVVVNSATPTVFIIGDNDFLRSIDCTRFMEEPSDIIAVGREFYICDFKAHNVCVIDEEGNFLRKFGNKHTTNFPNGIDVSQSGYIVTGDSHGNFFHVVVYSPMGDFISEFRCPFVKVSRCCGLKITSEGYIVTVDKNYHHVLILDTLQILK